MDLLVRYPVLLTADAWHLRTKGDWQKETSEAYRECYAAKERRFEREAEEEAMVEREAQEGLLDEDWILPDELLPEALLVEEIVAQENAPEDADNGHPRPGPIRVD